jgi:hypothetical protein
MNFSNKLFKNQIKMSLPVFVLMGSACHVGAMDRGVDQDERCTSTFTSPLSSRKRQNPFDASVATQRAKLLTSATSLEQRKAALQSAKALGNIASSRQEQSRANETTQFEGVASASGDVDSPDVDLSLAYPESPECEASLDTVVFSSVNSSGALVARSSSSSDLVPFVQQPRFAESFGVIEETGVKILKTISENNIGEIDPSVTGKVDVDNVNMYLNYYDTFAQYVEITDEGIKTDFINQCLVEDAFADAKIETFYDFLIQKLKEGPDQVYEFLSELVRSKIKSDKALIARREIDGEFISDINVLLKTVKSVKEDIQGNVSPDLLERVQSTLCHKNSVDAYSSIIQGANANHASECIELLLFYFDESQKSIRDLSTAGAKLSSVVESNADSINSLARQNNQLSNDNTLLREQHQTSLAMIADLNKQLSELRSEHECAKADLESTRADLQAARNTARTSEVKESVSDTVKRLNGQK